MPLTLHLAPTKPGGQSEHVKVPPAAGVHTPPKHGFPAHTSICRAAEKKNIYPPLQNLAAVPEMDGVGQPSPSKDATVCEEDSPRSADP